MNSNADSSALWNPPDLSVLEPEFPQLEIRELLAQGGMSAVYLAYHPGLERLEVLKVLPPEAAADAAARDRFRKEAQVLAGVKDHRVMAVYNFDISPGGYLYMQLEYESGGDLRRRMLGGGARPPVEEVLSLIAEVSAGLAAAHKKGIIHGDIKPDNIFLDEEGRPKLGDFGLAAFSGAGQATHHTPGYTAPEILQGQRLTTRSTDLYALGATLYELLTGQLPPATAGERRARLQTLPPAAAEVIAAALHEDPRQRPASAEAFAAMLRTARERLSPATKTVAPTVVPGRVPARQPVRVIQQRPATQVRRAATRGGHWVKVAIAGVLLGCAGLWFALRKPASAPEIEDGQKVVQVLPPANPQGNGQSPGEPENGGPVGAKSGPALEVPPAPDSFGAWLAADKGEQASSTGRKSATDEEIRAWNPEWTVEALKGDVNETVRFSTTPEDGRRVLVLHPFSKDRPFSITRTLTLPASPAQQLSVRVAAIRVGGADWELRALANGQPLGAPEIIAENNPGGRFRTVSWDLSAWQGKQVTLRLEGWDGGARRTFYEQAYWAWIKVEPSPAVQRIVPSTVPEKPRPAPQGESPALASARAEIAKLLSQMETFRSGERSKLHANIRLAREQAAKTISDKALAVEFAQSDPAKLWVTDEERAVHESGPEILGTWGYPRGGKWTYAPGGKLQEDAGPTWRWLDRSEGLFAMFGPTWSDLGHLEPGLARIVNSEGYRFEIRRLSEASAGSQRDLPHAVWNADRHEDRFRKEHQAVVSEKAWAVLARAKSLTATMPPADAVALLDGVLTALQGDLAEPALPSPEDTRYLSGTWRTAAGRLEFRQGGTLFVQGKAAGKWIWSRDDVLVFTFPRGAKPAAGIARISTTEKGVLRIHTLLGDNIGDAKYAEPNPSDSPVVMKKDRSGIPVAAQAFRGHRFCLISGSCTWHEARKKCEEMGGRLAVVPDDTTWTFVKSLGGGRQLWLGASDEQTEGTWQWMDGTPVTFHPWGRGEPNNTGGKEDYLIAYSSSGLWNDATDTGHDFGQNVAGFICEWGATAKAAVAKAPPAQSKAPGKLETIDYRGMTLAADWMPRLGERSDLLLSLEFYAKFAIQGGPPEKDAVPTELANSLKWLMSMDEAIKAMPSGANRIPERKIAGFCWPENSLTVAGFQIKGLNDRGQLFTQIFLIGDKARKLVGVQMVLENATITVPAGRELVDHGIRNPYFDFINLTASARGGVDYKVFRDPLLPGLAVIETQYHDGVRLYLTAPMARALLEIVQKNREAKFIK